MKAPELVPEEVLSACVRSCCQGPCLDALVGFVSSRWGMLGGYIKSTEHRSIAAKGKSPVARFAGSSEGSLGAASINIMRTLSFDRGKSEYGLG